MCSAAFSGAITAVTNASGLTEVCAEAFRLLSRGVADRRSPFRTPALATLGANGQPRVRTVVLRAFDPAARRIVLHSDARAGKVHEIAADPRAALHVWDDGRQVQVRLDGTATVQPGAARVEWDRLHAGSKSTYSVRPTPGSALADPTTADADRLQEQAAFANFAVIHLEVSGMEWLHLAPGGHRRAAFTWGPDGMQAEWLVP